MGEAPEASAVVAERIARAREVQHSRPLGRLNSKVSGRLLRALCRLDSFAERRAVELSELERMSGRGTERLLRVARTIADLAGSPTVTADHLDEAARFRSQVSRFLQRIAV
jgi:magnesium chelatase family protein